MQRFTQKYAIIQLFEEVPEDTEFFWKNWPLHSTVADVFAIEWEVPIMIEKLTGLLHDHAQATSVAEEDTFFGEDGQTRVTLLKKTVGLVTLHHDVIELLQQGGWVPYNPEFAKDGFLPHSTVQTHARLNRGDVVTFNALSIIDMFPDEDPYQRKVVRTIGLLD
jgi:hypothetical protein